MKKKILIFIAGVIVGGIITAAGFLIFVKPGNKMPGGRMTMDMNGEFTPPENTRERPAFQNGEFKGKTQKNNDITSNTTSNN